MPETSGSANLLRWTVPRWLYLAWIWSALPLSAVVFFECAETRFAHACHAVSNSDLSMPWQMPAMTVMFLPQETPAVLQLGFMLAFTMLCHLAIVRFIMPRSRAWVFALCLLAWSLSGMALFVAWLALHGVLGR